MSAIVLCICGHAHEGRECDICAKLPPERRWCSSFVPLTEAMSKRHPLSIRERALRWLNRPPPLSIRERTINWLRQTRR